MTRPRFSYYERLSAKDKVIYRKSEAISIVPLTDPEALAQLVRGIGDALQAGKRARVAAATQSLSDALLRQLGAPTLRVRVRETRPQIYEGAELHGLYTFAQEGKPPQIEVWMRTAARRDVVRFRTFFRTFLHEIVHHLDVTSFALDDSFHTEGFFRRESSLVRQLVPPRVLRETKQEPIEAPRVLARQLGLFAD